MTVSHVVLCVHVDVRDMTGSHSLTRTAAKKNRSSLETEVASMESRKKQNKKSAAIVITVYSDKRCGCTTGVVVENCTAFSQQCRI